MEHNQIYMYFTSFINFIETFDAQYEETQNYRILQALGIFYCAIYSVLIIHTKYAHFLLEELLDSDKNIHPYPHTFII